MKTSESINEIVTALVLVQSQIEPAPKNSINPHFKSSYSDLTSVWGACRSALAKHHLAVVQSPSFHEGRVIMITRLLHKSGQWIENELSLKPQQDTAQGIGSCITYARRYALAALVGVVADEDDDGNEASKKPPSYQYSEHKPKANPPVLFSKKNIDHVNRLEKLLIGQGINHEWQIKIMSMLEGKEDRKSVV